MSKHLNKVDQTVWLILDVHGNRTRKQLSRFLELEKDQISKSLDILMKLRFIDKTNDSEPTYFSLRDGYPVEDEDEENLEEED